MPNRDTGMPLGAEPISRQTASNKTNHKQAPPAATSDAAAERFCSCAVLRLSFAVLGSWFLVLDFHRSLFVLSVPRFANRLHIAILRVPATLREANRSSHPSALRPPGSRPCILFCKVSYATLPALRSSGFLPRFLGLIVCHPPGSAGGSSPSEGRARSGRHADPPRSKLRPSQREGSIGNPVKTASESRTTSSAGGPEPQRGEGIASLFLVHGAWCFVVRAPLAPEERIGKAR